MLLAHPSFGRLISPLIRLSADLLSRTDFLDRAACAAPLIAAKTEGTGKVLNIHASDTIRQLRAAGYTVAKQKTQALSSIKDDELLDALNTPV